ncbi:hypothetical protein BC830DRAFT_1101488 [Chytriomyces sp. MP71]|nr:hypothetical protein BC830DRAFT_1101488 [Chytriomyces sp. MP71]
MHFVLRITCCVGTCRRVARKRARRLQRGPNFCWRRKQLIRGTLFRGSLLSHKIVAPKIFVCGWHAGSAMGLTSFKSSSPAYMASTAAPASRKQETPRTIDATLRVRDKQVYSSWSPPVSVSNSVGDQEGTSSQPPNYLLDSYFHPPLAPDAAPSYAPAHLEIAPERANEGALSLLHPGTPTPTFRVVLDTARMRAYLGEMWKKPRTVNNPDKPKIEDCAPSMQIWDFSDQTLLCHLTPFSTTDGTGVFGFRFSSLMSPIAFEIRHDDRVSKLSLATFKIPSTDSKYEWRGETDPHTLSAEGSTVLTLYQKLTPANVATSLLPRKSLAFLSKLKQASISATNGEYKDLIPVAMLELSTLHKQTHTFLGTLLAMEGYEGDATAVLWKSKEEAALFAASAIAAAFVLKHVRTLRLHRNRFGVYSM